MIKLKTASLLEFQKRVQFIKTDTLRPVLSNLKLEHNGDRWQMIKNNLEAVCIGPVAADGDPATILINERIFFALLAGVKGDEITVRIDGDKILINDGFGDTELPIEDPVNFPVNPGFSQTEPPIQLTSQHLRAIKIASQFVSDTETSGNFQFVHVTPDMGVFGFHNNYFYINTAFSGLPEMSLRSDECEIICTTEGVGFISLDRHHVFFNGGYTYIFTKSEAKPMNITGIVGRLQQSGKDFLVTKDALIGFCNSANVVSESPLVDCLISPMPMGIKLSMKDVNYNRGTERLVLCDGSPDQFSFNSRLITAPVKAIPYDLLEAKTNQNNLIISGRGGAGNGLGSEVNEWFVFVGMQK